MLWTISAEVVSSECLVVGTSKCTINQDSKVHNAHFLHVTLCNKAPLLKTRAANFLCQLESLMQCSMHASCSHFQIWQARPHNHLWRMQMLTERCMGNTKTPVLNLCERWKCRPMPPELQLFDLTHCIVAVRELCLCYPAGVPLVLGSSCKLNSQFWDHLHVKRVLGQTWVLNFQPSLLLAEQTWKPQAYVLPGGAKQECIDWTSCFVEHPEQPEGVYCSYLLFVGQDVNLHCRHGRSGDGRWCFCQQTTVLDQESPKHLHHQPHRQQMCCIDWGRQYHNHAGFARKLSLTSGRRQLRKYPKHH